LLCPFVAALRCIMRLTLRFNGCGRCWQRYLDQEEKLEAEMKLEALLHGLIGLQVRKAFKGHGIFSGQIKSLRRDSNDVPLWLVKYEDGSSYCRSALSHASARLAALTSSLHCRR
jgi:hypothetical protein